MNLQGARRKLLKLLLLLLLLLILLLLLLLLLLFKAAVHCREKILITGLLTPAFIEKRRFDQDFPAHHQVLSERECCMCIYLV